MDLALEVKLISTFTELVHIHGEERWPTEVTSNTYFRGVDLPRAVQVALDTSPHTT